MIELLIVLQIIGILILIALPSYLGFRDRASKRAAQSNLREAIPAVETYADDHNRSYASMTPAALKAIDAGVSSTLLVKSSGATSYCLTSTVKGWTAFVLGPGGLATMTAVC